MAEPYTLCHLRPLPQEPPGGKRTRKEKKAVLEKEEVERDVREDSKI